MDEMTSEEIHIVELHMMDKRKYFPLTIASNIAVRSLLYPFHVVRTHLQTQVGKEAYSGTIDAFSKIYSSQGLKGMYRGLPVHLCLVLPGVGYIYTYEYTRTFIKHHTSLSDMSKTLIAGGMASVVAQIFNTPFDIISQHMMLVDGRKQPMQGIKAKPAIQKSLQQIHIPDEMKQKRFGVFQTVVKHVFKTDGILGFYRGLSMSMCLFVPNSALFWFFYEHLKGEMMSILPESVPRMLINSIASPMAGVAASIITNPVDVVKVRMQIKRTTLRETLRTLHREEPYFWAVKGIYARLAHTSISSITLIVGYEAVKRLSLKKQYLEQVRW
ncbi:solute carrier family 25 member 44-like isoform X1 [Dreissena polymorpha]|uniref:solute carrier family 25 member 44-like isoform X1 n=1 Tax=Dreissena polymorpha TaxID=45954 RepID=UPI002263BEC9|nr:solute carrier family 25 member 44-like isoform X1 [Dreissena polymorpha]XP_052255682.1 solute carrier family 25 member 44-like isoform X1 [Dreissena polymorpha]XP_052255684.1 solute carrier family 25 member 44-like isoform X1 [Dreissena polymorpha]XP_052255685.1 solute carrier family 25 member 44-like isoform X1 [Dreissena polymorpha]XP_052255686.1 solute carrier family 25 member 44-like isoform X1 [Dreissena polymorpha]